MITGCSKWPIFSPTHPGCTKMRLFLAKAALSETRTNDGPGHVSACQGWVGETADIFNILLGWTS